MIKNQKKTFSILCFFLILNFSFWNYAKDIQKEWMNVPVAPSLATANLSFLGDQELAYRAYAVMLQNIGSVDGKNISLKIYDYSKLKKWFFLMHDLNPRSDIMPLLAAYYYGGIRDNEKLGNVLDYLEVVGASPDEEKWRWLGHAVYIARHVMKDNDRALELAYKLSENKSPDLADWAKQMPVYILQDQGDTELAYKIMLNILISNVDNLHPNEIFFMQDYICNTLIPSDPNLPKLELCDTLKTP